MPDIIACNCFQNFQQHGALCNFSATAERVQICVSDITDCKVPGTRKKQSEWFVT